MTTAAQHASTADEQDTEQTAVSGLVWVLSPLPVRTKPRVIR